MHPSGPSKLMSVRPAGHFLIIFGDPFPDLPKLKRKKEGSKKWSKPDICLFLGTRFRIYQSLNAKKRGPKQPNSCFDDLT